MQFSHWVSQLKCVKDNEDILFLFMTYFCMSLEMLLGSNATSVKTCPFGLDCFFWFYWCPDAEALHCWPILGDTWRWVGSCGAGNWTGTCEFGRLKPDRCLCTNLKDQRKIFRFPNKERWWRNIEYWVTGLKYVLSFVELFHRHS